MSFADFNTTLMVVGSDSPLTVMMYGRMREGASPGVERRQLVSHDRIGAAGAGVAAAGLAQRRVSGRHAAQVIGVGLNANATTTAAINSAKDTA